MKNSFLKTLLMLIISISFSTTIMANTLPVRANVSSHRATSKLLKNHAVNTTTLDLLLWPQYGDGGYVTISSDDSSVIYVVANSWGTITNSYQDNTTPFTWYPLSSFGGYASTMVDRIDYSVGNTGTSVYASVHDTATGIDYYFTIQAQ